MDAIDKSPLAGADFPRKTAAEVAAVGEVMGLVVFLTFATSDPVVGCMRRRVLQVGTAFEPTRSSAQQLQLAYEQVIATVRRRVNDEGVVRGDALVVDARSTRKGAS
jgi:hypothetical protein